MGKVRVRLISKDGLEKELFYPHVPRTVIREVPPDTIGVVRFDDDSIAGDKILDTREYFYDGQETVHIFRER